LFNALPPKIEMNNFDFYKPTNMMGHELSAQTHGMTELGEHGDVTLAVSRRVLVAAL
jgi:hypothetical protein